MLSHNTSLEHTPAISPAQLASLLPSRPLLSSDEGFWRNVVLQHYRHPPSCVSVPPLQDHLLVVHLSGAVLIEEKRACGRVERRWADSGQMSLTPAGQGITRVLKGRPEVLLVCLPPHFVRELAEEINFGAANGELVPRLAVADQVVYRLGWLLLDEASGEAPARLMVETLTRALAIHLLKSHSSAASRRPEAPICMPRGKLGRVIEYMRTHMDESLSLSQLANLSGLSPSQFTRSFRAAMGKPPHSYLIDLRIEKARDLLERTDLPVIEVGMQCGFAQPNHFATTFRKVVGLAPRAWRVARRA